MLSLAFLVSSRPTLSQFSEPHNPPNDSPQLHNVRQSPDFEAPKLWNIRPGWVPFDPWIFFFVNSSEHGRRQKLCCLEMKLDWFYGSRIVKYSYRNWLRGLECFVELRLGGRAYMHLWSTLEVDKESQMNLSFTSFLFLIIAGRAGNGGLFTVGKKDLISGAKVTRQKTWCLV